MLNMLMWEWRRLYQYITYEERLEIEAGLSGNKVFGEIGREIVKDRTTVTIEIKTNAVDKKQVAFK